MRVAIVAGPNPARAFPAAALALGLIDNGDDVLLLAGSRWLDRLRDLGVRAEPMTEPRGEGEHRKGSPTSPTQVVTATPAIRDRLVEFGPDLVVADVRTPAGGFAAELMRVPWAQLHPRPMVFSATAERHGGHRERGRGGLFGAGRSRADRRTQRDLSTVRESLGLSAVGPGPLLHMVATLPHLEPPRPDWPRHATVVGPLIWDPAIVDLRVPEGDSPLVLVSPSTSTLARKSLLDVALKGVHGMRLVGTVLEPYDKPLPPWASVGPGQQEPLLAQASVVVTGGGHGMIVRSLCAGVPLVLAPADGEMELARAAERLGAAIVLRRADPRSLSRAIERVLEDRTYASAARQISRTAASADPVLLCHQVLVGRTAA